MWDRKRLKRRARINIKKNYFSMIVVCFCMCVFVGAHFYTKNSFTLWKGIIFPDAEDALGMQNREGIVGGIVGGINVVSTQFGNIVNRIAELSPTVNDICNLLNSFASLIISVFVLRPLYVGEARFFEENHSYHHTPFHRMFANITRKRYWSSVKVSLRVYLFRILWAFTIAGIPIKYYSYKMAYYIVAENPKVTAKQAIKISQSMMKGNKWKAFCLDLSMAHWYILNFLVPFGLVGIFFSNPYTVAVESELYFVLRDKAIRENTEYAYVFSDKMLIVNTKKSIAYPGVRSLEIADDKAFYKHYSITHLILFFFSFSIVGWIWETVFHIVETGELVNRGTLYGPWLPIYGTGCAAILLCLYPKKLRKFFSNPVITFLSIMIICGIVEYFTGLYFDKAMGAKYWDYSMYCLNINSYVCLEGTLFFGLGGIGCIYFVAPLMDRLFAKIPEHIKIIICVVLITVFIWDATIAHFFPRVGQGITY